MRSAQFDYGSLRRPSETRLGIRSLVACSRRRKLHRLRCSANAASEKLTEQVVVVLGTQWGDEGKGKLVDILAQQYDVVARAQVTAMRPTS